MKTEIKDNVGRGGVMAGRQSDTYVIVGEYMSPVRAGGRHSFNNS